MPEQTIIKIACPTCGQKLDVTAIATFSTIACPVCGGEVIIPKLFGDLLLEEPIGCTEVASVYRALDLKLDREVAVKILASQAAARPQCVEGFLREARKAAAVNHVNIVPIYSCGDVEGQPYLVMQFMAGGSMEERLREHRGTIPLPFCLNVALAAARGLREAHEAGIVHHSIKPGNILLDAEGNAKLSDFGLAEASRPATGSDAWHDPHYVSCEKVRSGSEDHRGDIYALGATLYHVLTGQTPFSGRTPEDVAHVRTTGAQPVPLTELRDAIPAPAADVIMRMLAADLEDRPQSCGPLVEVLAELVDAGHRTGVGPTLSPLAGPGTAATSLPELAEQSSAPDPGDGVSGPTAPQRAPWRRLEFWLNAALALAIVCLLGLVVTAIRNRRQASLIARDGREARAAALPLPPQVDIPDAVDGSTRPGSGTAAAGRDGHGGPKQALRRPRPDGLAFGSVKTELDAYLAGIPPAARQTECERIRYLELSRSYLVQLMGSLPFADSGPGIKLGSGAVLEGSVAHCDDREIIVRLAAPTTGLKRLAWSELAFEQYVAFFDFYLSARLEQSSPAIAGEDGFRLALLCDWYGRSDLATAYAARALQYDAALKQRVSRFFPDAPSAIRSDG